MTLVRSGVKKGNYNKKTNFRVKWSDFYLSSSKNLHMLQKYFAIENSLQEGVLQVGPTG